MELLGPIVRLQVQTSGLKVGERPYRRYDPAPIQGVARLAISSAGVTGWTADGERLEDVHHEAHPTSKNRGGNAVSICFTSHYGAMRRRFGTHLVDGVAGENVLIATGVSGGGSFADGELTDSRLIVETDSGRVELADLACAEPCVEFARFALGRDGDTEDALRFLRRGMRGYYAASPGEGIVEVGDLVYLA